MGVEGDDPGFDTAPKTVGQGLPDELKRLQEGRPIDERPKVNSDEFADDSLEDEVHTNPERARQVVEEVSEDKIKRVYEDFNLTGKRVIEKEEARLQRIADELRPQDNEAEQVSEDHATQEEKDNDKE